MQVECEIFKKEIVLRFISLVLLFLQKILIMFEITENYFRYN